MASQSAPEAWANLPALEKGFDWMTPRLVLMKLAPLFLSLLLWGSAAAGVPLSAPPAAAVDLLKKLNTWIASTQNYETEVVLRDLQGRREEIRYHWRGTGKLCRWEGKKQIDGQLDEALNVVFDGKTEWVSSTNVHHGLAQTKRVRIDQQKVLLVPDSLTTGFSLRGGTLMIPSFDLPNSIQLLVQSMAVETAEPHDGAWVLTGRLDGNKLLVSAGGSPEPGEAQLLCHLRLTSEGVPLGLTVFTDRDRGFSIGLQNLTTAALDPSVFRVDHNEDYLDKTNELIFERLSEQLLMRPDEYLRTVAQHPDWFEQAHDGEFPSLLHFAAAYGSSSALKTLAAPPAWFLKLDSKGHSPLMVALDKGNTAAVDYCCQLPLDQRQALLCQTDPLGNTPLHQAAQNGNRQLCELLLRAGANRNLRNRAGRLAWQLAPQAGLAKLLR